MKISNVLDFIDSGDMALPEFQRGYVWNRDQVRGLFESLYRLVTRKPSQDCGFISRTRFSSSTSRSRCVMTHSGLTLLS